jgi:hypothetical protein
MTNAQWQIEHEAEKIRIQQQIEQERAQIVLQPFRLCARELWPGEEGY